MREPGVTEKACAVVNTADGKPDGSSDAGSNSGTMDFGSYSLPCAEDTGLTTVLSALLPAATRSLTASDSSGH